MAADWKLVTGYELAEYPCGLRAGDRVRLTRELVVLAHTGEINEVRPSGEVWTVLPGVENEPAVIWFRRPDGDRHTWDAANVFDWFERVP